MQVEHCEFERIKQKLDQIKPNHIRSVADFLDTALMRLDALDEELYTFQLHAKDSISNLEKSINAMSRVIESGKGTLGSHDGYAIRQLTIVSQLTTVRVIVIKERIEEHRSLEKLVLEEYRLVVEDLEGVAGSRQKSIEEVHSGIKDQIFGTLQAFSNATQLRQNEDTEIAITLAKNLEILIKQTKQINKSELDLHNMMCDVATSVPMGIRQLKEQRQPTQKLLFDKISQICDRLRQQTLIQ